MYQETNRNAIPSRDTLAAGQCPVKWALNVATVARQGNDGKNVMGRDGMAQLRQILVDLTTGNAEDGDVELVREICNVIITTPGCAISGEAAANILWSLENNEAEWKNHQRKKCAANDCYQAAAGAGIAGLEGDAPAGGMMRRRGRRG